MLTHAVMMVVMLSGGSGAQRQKPSHVFAYNPLALEEFNKEQQAKLNGEHPEPSETEAQAKTVKKPNQAPASYVSISGNFGGVFYVTGVGGSTSQTQSNFVNITTNRALTFSAISFRPLQLGGSSENAMGTVTYSMALYQGNSAHVGALIAGPVSGTDASFNGLSVAVNSAQLPSGGSLVLRISRTLTLTGQATGACTLVGTGYIGVTIN
jgi:hypothetical protein